MEVAAVSTPLTRDATAAMLVPAYVDVFGEAPDQDRAELLLALIWMENANGQAFTDHNWGGLSTAPSDGVDYFRPSWYDLGQVNALPDSERKSRLLERHAQMLAGKVPQAFRAFASHDDGIRAWLKLLATPSKAPVLKAATSGDAVRFAHAIYDTNYCPDAQCRAAGPSYARLRDLIHAAGYFDGLEKKKTPAAVVCSRSSWSQELPLPASMHGRSVAADAQPSEAAP